MSTLVLLSAFCFGADPQEEARAALAEVERTWRHRRVIPRPPVIFEEREPSQDGPAEDPFAPENKRTRPPLEVNASSLPQALLIRRMPPDNPEARIVRVWSPPAAVRVMRQPVMMQPQRRFISAPIMQSGYTSSSRMMGIGSRMMLRGGSRSGGCST